jgi:DNA-binding winged helix-turn-helix (wHTH) protein
VTVRFGPFILDHDTRQLTRDGREVRLSPKAFELLWHLAQARPRVVSKAELQQHLWPETFVVEANLSNLVAEIRAALGDDARDPLYIRTSHGFGYALRDGAATQQSVEEAPALPCWIEWGQRRFPLSFGEHVIGRGSDVDVNLDASTVSRHHARLVVTAEGATLEDTVSTNGTFRDGQRVTTPVRLVDGDAIAIGSVIITFHVESSAEATATLPGTRT